ncbi:MAG: LegC family aminotransferase [Saprospiraceae bacterium]
MYKSIIEFIRKTYETPKDNIYLHEPRFIGNEKAYLIDAIDSTFVSSVGAYVNRFEKMMTEITGAKYAIAVVNGTASLHIALKLAGVQQGDEVLSQPLTFIATANAISYEKAIPHFIDVDEDTLGMSPIALKKRLEAIAEVKDGQCFNKETGNKIAACVPMHTFGLSLRIDEIVDICNQYCIPVVEDAAESLGSYYKEKHTGTFGLLGTFSFNGNKTVTCGGGGAIITNDEALAKRAKHITTTAKIPHRWEYAHDEIGYNYRMPNLNAALACAQLEQLDSYIQNKRETAKKYHQFFEKLEGINSLKELENSFSNYWLNAIRFSSKDERNNFLEYSNDNGIMTRPIWKLMNKLDMFKNCPKGNLSVSNALEDTIVNIPSSVKV